MIKGSVVGPDPSGYRNVEAMDPDPELVFAI
jgi:hypothetical protein